MYKCQTTSEGAKRWKNSCGTLSGRNQ